MPLQAGRDAFKVDIKAGKQLLAISPQNPVSRKSMRDNGLGFPILSDPGNETAAAFGRRVALPGYLSTCTRASRMSCRCSTVIRAGRCRCRAAS
jgi:peroxiredoxin